MNNPAVKPGSFAKNARFHSPGDASWCPNWYFDVSCTLPPIMVQWKMMSWKMCKQFPFIWASFPLPMGERGTFWTSKSWRFGWLIGEWSSGRAQWAFSARGVSWGINRVTQKRLGAIDGPSFVEMLIDILNPSFSLRLFSLGCRHHLWKCVWLLMSPSAVTQQSAIYCIRHGSLCWLGRGLRSHKRFWASFLIN